MNGGHAGHDEHAGFGYPGVPLWDELSTLVTMAPVMIFLMMSRDMRAMWPGEPLFWFVMSLGVVAGFVLAYPVNVWLVAKGMKHGSSLSRVGN